MGHKTKHTTYGPPDIIAVHKKECTETLELHALGVICKFRLQKLQWHLRILLSMQFQKFLAFRMQNVVMNLESQNSGVICKFRLQILQCNLQILLSTQI
jgi:hypothetical protein